MSAASPKPQIALAQRASSPHALVLAWRPCSTAAAVSRFYFFPAHAHPASSHVHIPRFSGTWPSVRGCGAHRVPPAPMLGIPQLPMRRIPAFRDKSFACKRLHTGCYYSSDTGWLVSFPALRL
ncbi:hypothetical protein IQ06DRAFT_27825 [Phaeosphaeriaceae sp. SRC1lsM3a]|nr:hypothetical protein IQ06DRAFT_27825 [Stagonospora sp. SRC1lsM3a]